MPRVGARQSLRSLEAREQSVKSPPLSPEYLPKTMSRVVVNQQAGPQTHPVETLIEAVRDALAESTLAAEDARRIAAEARAAAGALRVAG